MHRTARAISRHFIAISAAPRPTCSVLTPGYKAPHYSVTHSKLTTGTRDRFRRVQHVRPNRDLRKKKASTGQRLDILSGLCGSLYDVCCDIQKFTRGCTTTFCALRTLFAGRIARWDENLCEASFFIEQGLGFFERNFSVWLKYGGERITTCILHATTLLSIVHVGVC